MGSAGSGPEAIRPAPLGHSISDMTRTATRRHAATSITMLTFTRQRMVFLHVRPVATGVVSARCTCYAPSLARPAA